MTRDEAVARGHKTYFGKPCQNGHDGERYVVNWTCVHCTRASTRERKRRLREAAREAA